MDKVKFTKASKKDGSLVTVSLTELANFVDTLLIDYTTCFTSPKDLSLGQEFILTVAGVRTLFTVNREGRTATTKTFPRKLRMPSVGRPILATVDNVADLVD